MFEVLPGLDKASKLLREWAYERHLGKDATEEDLIAQCEKLKEELDETMDAIKAGDGVEFVDGLGDIFVVWMMLHIRSGKDPIMTVSHAYNEIKDRIGVTYRGKYIKLASLAEMSEDELEQVLEEGQPQMGYTMQRIRELLEDME